MDWKWSKEEDDFRQEVRDYLKAELPSGWGKEIFYDQDDDEHRSESDVHLLSLPSGMTCSLLIRPC